MKSLVIFGTGQMSDLVSGYFANDSMYEVVAYCADDLASQSRFFQEKEVVPFDSLRSHFPPAEVDVFIAISYHSRNQIRKDKFEQAVDSGYQMASYVSSKASVIDPAAIGQNCLVLENSCLQQGVVLGNNVTLWTGVQVGHHSMIGDHVFIGAGAVLMGCNSVGESSHIGANVTVKDHVGIARGNVIEPSCYIERSTSDDEDYFAFPARVAEEKAIG